MLKASAKAASEIGALSRLGVCVLYVEKPHGDEFPVHDADGGANQPAEGDAHRFLHKGSAHRRVPDVTYKAADCAVDGAEHSLV